MFDWLRFAAGTIGALAVVALAIAVSAFVAIGLAVAAAVAALAYRRRLQAAMRAPARHVIIEGEYEVVRDR